MNRSQMIKLIWKEVINLNKPEKNDLKRESVNVSFSIYYFRVNFLKTLDLS